MFREGLDNSNLNQETLNEALNFSEATLVTARHVSEWEIETPSSATLDTTPDKEQLHIHKKLSEALSIFNNILGTFPYVSLTFKTPGDISNNGEIEANFVKVHLSRPQGQDSLIAVNIVPDSDKGVRYSDISSRAFGIEKNGQVLSDPSSVGEHFTLERANEMLRMAFKCEEAIARFRHEDVIIQNNPQGIQEYVNQPLGGFKDTGGQNKYVECFARALGSTIPAGKDSEPCQILINRSGPSQTDILQNQKPPVSGGDPSVRKGVHFFPDENICLAFVEDSHPNVFTVKEEAHPRWLKVDAMAHIPPGHDYVVVENDELGRFGIENGIYLMTDAGPMKELAAASHELLDYFEVASAGKGADSERKVVLANHYADAAYLAEFMAREMGTRFESFFFLHSLGTFKAEGLEYPDKLMSDVASADELERKLRLTDRILGELWVVQQCKQSLIANSDGIASHAHKYLGARHEPPTMIAVDDAADRHIGRGDRKHLAMRTFEKLFDSYLQSCENSDLGDPVPAEKRLSLTELINAQIIFERSRHAEADSKGKWAVVKAMAIAQSDPRAHGAEAPVRVLVINVNLAAKHEKDEKFRKEINTIVSDIQSFRANGGHVIVQPSFDYHFGLDICKIADCYVALPAFEPFGMGVLEAAAAGASVIARSDVPSVKEILSKNVSTVKFPLRNNTVMVALAEGAVLVGGHPDNSKEDPAKYTEAAYNGAAVAINAITLGVPPITSTLTFDPILMGENASNLVRNSRYNWRDVSKRFYEEVYRKYN